MVASESGEVGNPSTLGMTKGRVALPFRFDAAVNEQQVPPLRYAPVGMTNLFGNAKYSFQVELSSRPERTRISCHAALDRAACAPFREEGRMKYANANKFHRKSGGA